MAGSTRKINRGALPIDPAIPEEVTKLVADVETLRAGLNALATAYNAALAKLDADGGVTDTNYAATLAVVRTSYDAAGDLTAGNVES